MKIFVRSISLPGTIRVKKKKLGSSHVFISLVQKSEMADVENVELAAID